MKVRKWLDGRSRFATGEVTTRVAKGDIEVMVDLVICDGSDMVNLGGWLYSYGEPDAQRRKRFDREAAEILKELNTLADVVNAVRNEAEHQVAKASDRLRAQEEKAAAAAKVQE